MKEVYSIFVPTITPDVETLNDDILKEMALDLNSDFATLKQVFAGSGIGCFRRTGDKKLAYDLVGGFKKYQIPFAAVSMSVLTNTPVIKAHKIRINDEGFTVTDEKMATHSYFFDSISMVGTETGISKINVKNSLLKCKWVAIAYEESSILIDTEFITYENMENYNKYSKLNNTINFIELIGKNGKEVYYDKSFNALKIQLDNSFNIYAALLCKAVKKELYKGLPEKYFHIKKDEIKKQISFDYTIYRGMALFKRKHKINKNKSFLSPYNYLVITGLIMIYISFEMSVSYLLIISAALMTLGFILDFFKLSKLKHLINDLPTSKLRSVSAGLVEVKGKITGKQVFISPISGAECVFFRYRKYKKVRTRNKEYWSVSEIGEGIPSKCYIDDGTGIIALNLKNAEIKVKSPENYTSTYKEMEAGFVPSFFSNVKYEEEIIQTGESVYVIGTAVPERRSIQFGEFLSEAKKNQINVARFDIDGNGILDQQEWELAVPELRNDFRKKVLDNGQSYGLILDKDKDSNLLIVATEREEKILSKIKWRVPVYLVLGILSFVFLIFSIILNF